MLGFGKARQIDARTIVVDETAMLPIMPNTHVDQTDAERDRARAADRLGYRALLQAFHWDDEDFARASSLGFPAAAGRFIEATTRGLGESWWHRSAVRAWVDRVRAMAADLPKTLR